MNVRFFGGRKEEYLSIPKHNPIGLYFCADTRELFLGDRLLSDGMRVVPTFADLPSISEHKAAEGIIYFVEATKNGYVLPRGRSEWLQVIYAPTTGEGADIDLSDYYTKAEVDEAILKAIANIEIEVDLNNYATKEYVDEQVASIEIPKVPTKLSELENDKGYVTYKELPVSLSQNVYALDFSGYRTSDAVTPEQDEALSKLFDADFSTPRKPSAIVYIKDSQLDNTWRLVDKVRGSYVVQADRLEFSTVLSVARDDDSAILNELLFTFERFRNISDASDVGTWFIKDAAVLKSTKLVTDSQLAEVMQRIEALQKMPTKLSELENDVGFITEHQDISHLATKEEVTVIQQQSARNEVKILAIDSELLDIKEQIANIPTTDLAGYATKEEVAAVEAKIPSIEGLATKQELEEAIASIEHPTIDLTGYATTEAVEAIADELAQTQGQLDRVTNGVENLQRVVGNLDATAVKQKYEVLPLEGMFVQYNDNEIRVNTQHVDIATLPTQNAGDGSSDSYYYATFRAYAPEGATSVIEGSSDKMDTEHSELAIDSYGRKYTTIWPAIASKSGSTWSKFGDRSNVDKYLGFYYNFHWYAGDKLISKEKVRVILTNDACHNDLVPDAVARRIDDKVSTVITTVNNLSETVENIENTYVQNSTLENYVTNDYITQNYVTNNYIVENYTTKQDLEATYVTNEKVTEVVTQEVNTVVTEQIETKVTEVIQEKVDAGELAVTAELIKYDTWD